MAQCASVCAKTHPTLACPLPVFPHLKLTFARAFGKANATLTFTNHDDTITTLSSLVSPSRPNHTISANRLEGFPITANAPIDKTDRPINPRTFAVLDGRDHRKHAAGIRADGSLSSRRGSGGEEVQGLRPASPLRDTFGNRGAGAQFQEEGRVRRHPQTGVGEVQCQRMYLPIFRHPLIHTALSFASASSANVVHAIFSLSFTSTGLRSADHQGHPRSRRAGTGA